MEISIITPIYKGNKYLNQYLDNVSKACKNRNDVEVIWINDSPEIQIEYDKNLVKNFDLIIIENQRNMGIHKSRCIGLNKAAGKYVLFLDQDDCISENSIDTQYNLIKNDVDIVLGNGLYENEEASEKIFKNKFSQDFATKKKPYILSRNFIISPGQCLIRRDSIPRYWLENNLEYNGADDYLLWLLMFNKQCRIVCNYDIVYIHKYTGNNVSLDDEKMFNSQLEVIKYLEKNDKYNRKDLKNLKKAILYKHNYKKNFLIETLKNLDIFIYNLYYRLVWRGYISK